MISLLKLWPICVVCLSLSHSYGLAHRHHLSTAPMSVIWNFRFMLLFTHEFRLGPSWNIWIHTARLLEIFFFHTILSLRYFVNNCNVWHGIIAMMLRLMMLFLPSLSLIIQSSRWHLSWNIITFKYFLLISYGLSIILAFCIGQKISRLSLIGPDRSWFFQLTLLNLLLYRSLRSDSQIIQKFVYFLLILNFIDVSQLVCSFYLCRARWWKWRVGLPSQIFDFISSIRIVVSVLRLVANLIFWHALILSTLTDSALIIIFVGDVMVRVISGQFWQLIYTSSFSWNLIKLFGLNLSHLVLNVWWRHLVTDFGDIMWWNTVFLVERILLALTWLPFGILFTNIQFWIYRFSLWRFATAGMYIRIVKLGVHGILLFSELLDLLLLSLDAF